MPPRSERVGNKAEGTAGNVAPERTGPVGAPITSASFEENIAELEAIVQDLERGDLTLEESILLFEQGVALSNTCRQRLEEAETRVEILLRKGGKMVPEPVAEDMNPARGSNSSPAGAVASTGEEFSDNDSIPF